MGRRAASTALVSPRRPHPRAARPLLACTPQPQTETLKDRLENILDAIPKVLDRATEQVESSLSSIPRHVQYLFSEEGPLGALNFWRENKEDIENTGRALLDTGDALAKGDTRTFRQRVSRLDFRWLRPRPGVTPEPQEQPQVDLERRVRNVVLFMIESLTPWDFDRHDFGLTFATVWLDVDALKRDDNDPVVKMTSTIKPVEREWKLTARTKLVDLGDDAVVFGKAGLYLAGDQPAYIGVEADRVWKLPRLDNTKFFVNVNYRSSRKPHFDPIRTSLGIQQDFFIGKGLDLTLRLGINPLDREDWYVTPVPNSSYF